MKPKSKARGYFSDEKRRIARTAWMPEKLTASI
jgi:hypothetical protein